MTTQNQPGGRRDRAEKAEPAANFEVEGDRVNIEFRLEDLVRQVLPSAVGHCGGCYGCSGCSH